MEIKKFSAAGMLLFSFCGCYWRTTQVIPDQPALLSANATRLAVFPFKDARADPSMIQKFPAPISELQEKIIARLSSNPRFQVVEREELARLLEEQKLQLTGAVDSQTAVQLGKFLGVKAVLMGSITEHGRDRFRIPWAKTVVTFRLVDVETASVMCAREVVARNVNMFYPFNNVSASLDQAANGVAKALRR